MTSVRRIAAAAVLMLLAACSTTETLSPPKDPLPSWNDGATKEAITTFVEAVTTEGGPDYVAPADRIATFDNDGTLWPSHPMYAQLAFVIDRIEALAPQHPEWKNKQPFKAVLENDMQRSARPARRGWSSWSWPLMPA
ncbi:MAG: hypothetical protein R3D25_11180 [Geminicoccaceae bacterium]